jgi:hypothetical protein
MIRKFNYTGRKKLNKGNISITLTDDVPVKSFTADIDFEGMNIPEEASVFIEPYYKSSFMRFDFGKVGAIIPPSNRYLTDIPSSSTILFRVKIVDESGVNGRLIRFADKIHPINVEPERINKQSILRVNWEAELGQQVYKVSFDTDGPMLEINRKLDNRREIIKSDAFFSLVYPSVVRQIAEEIFRPPIDWGEGDDNWQSKWIQFFKKALYVGESIDFEEAEETEQSLWINQIVEAFCNKYRVRSKFENSLNSK